MGSTIGRRSLALLCAAVLGIALGVVVAVQTAQPERPPAATPENPLGVENATLENVGCDGSILMIVGYGDTDRELQATASGYQGVRYLEKSKSCDTIYPGRSDAYANYVGPFATMAEACKARMTPTHFKDPIVRMNEDVEDFVPCACVVPIASLPDLKRLRPEERTIESLMWTREYQRLLAKAGLLAEDGIDGKFNQRMEDVTRNLQAAGGDNPFGVVDVPTWSLAISKGCGKFNF